MVEHKNGGHQGVALASDSPPTGSLDLGDESMHVCRRAGETSRGRAGENRPS